MVRKPIVSGMFYPSDFTALDKSINRCFLHELGPGLPNESNGKRIFGVISPHAGYSYSGLAASWVFKEIGESKLPSTYIMLGLSHQGFKTSLSLKDFETPFGVVRNDKELVREIEKYGIEVNEVAHTHEHSIEVELPFLQFVNKKRLKDIRIIPLICSNDIDPSKLADIIYRAVTKLSRDIVVIASSDFTHYGENYDYVPFKENIKEKMHELDKKAISYILDMNSEGFLSYVKETGATICGKYPIAVTIELVKKLGSKKGKLLCYYTSADISDKDYDMAVGYGSIVF